MLASCFKEPLRSPQRPHRHHVKSKKFKSIRPILHFTYNFIFKGLYNHTLGRPIKSLSQLPKWYRALNMGLTAGFRTGTSTINETHVPQQSDLKPLKVRLRHGKGQATELHSQHRGLQVVLDKVMAIARIQEPRIYPKPTAFLLWSNTTIAASEICQDLRATSGPQRRAKTIVRPLPY